MFKNIYFQGLSGLQHLRELNLSDNQIPRIGNSLNSLPVLENVELSGNRLTSLKVSGKLSFIYFVIYHIFYWVT